MNQNPEQLARDRIAQQLIACGWTIQDKKSINLHAASGVAVREYQTVITAIYRLLKFAHAKRILFLVDTKNLGVQAEQEFLSYLPTYDNRKFPELYNVQRFRSSYVATDSQVCISTIQRLYSILKGEELDESSEEINPGEIKWNEKRAPVPVGYNSKISIEFFDFIVIDECHQSIYNLWKQVLDYFDAFLIGLPTTPDNRTFGFFNQSIVSDYGFEKVVTDGTLISNSRLLHRNKDVLT